MSNHIEDVLQFIEKHNSRYFTISTITNKTGLTACQVGYALRKLKDKKIKKRTKVTWEIIE